ncbi:hypothetical protein QYG06_17845 [Xanthomonas euvesicatoria]|uniref:Uncharacterized protein n=2 Tax=Xanthomonas euvesicatoria TaxID=456327 RepID=Q3C049_XANE5|nr:MULTISPECIES: hypothetical protein [Xanthomonas]AOY69491.1 hypothetical protein BHE83_23235 [Xanthomonas euvesicatoria pv. vesicatoria str. 85-10]APO88715.1 hypothetical protein BJD11_00640 [Xanthomonas euvesicatoria]KHL62532.1 hypothetical protein XEU66b_06525 [Xanthomonas euvesicatoria]KLB38585.1 hypothetical protein XEUV206_19555 [Xanthomonas euvesicatoria]KLB43769.1 hypothetical protein XEUV259_20525 [Xanthomonas euvesicatoria]
MVIRASAFVIKKDIDVPLGSVFAFEESWFFRAQVDDGGDIQEVGINLTDGAKYVVLTNPTSALTLAHGLALELRVIGPIRGPGKPPLASLAWSINGGPAISMVDYFLALDGGKETTDVRTKHAFFATHWGAWVIDSNGKPISPDPLFVIGSDS